MLLRSASVSIGPQINSESADFNVLYPPASVAVDTNGNVYVADPVSSTIEKFSAADLSEFTIGGTNGLVGSFDGPAGRSLFSSPSGIAVDDAGNVYVADTGNNTIRKGFFSLYARANPVTIPEFPITRR